MQPLPAPTATTAKGQSRTLRADGVDAAPEQIGGKNDTIACKYCLGGSASGRRRAETGAVAVVLLQNPGGSENTGCAFRAEILGFRGPVQPVRWPFAADYLQMQQTAKPAVDSGATARRRIKAPRRLRSVRLRPCRVASILARAEALSRKPRRISRGPAGSRAPADGSRRRAAAGSKYRNCGRAAACRRRSRRPRSAGRLRDPGASRRC